MVFTPPQWFAMCAHMMNENPQNFFLMPYQDKDGKAKFAKAYNAKADDRIAWAWDTITGKAKVPGVNWLLSDQCSTPVALGGDGFRYARRRPDASA